MKLTIDNQEIELDEPMTVFHAAKKLGIEVEIKSIVWTSQWAKAKGDPKEAQDIFLLMWWPTYSDPYETLYSLLHNEKGKPVWNLAYYVNPAYDNMIRKAYEVTGSDPASALDMYVQAQNIVQKDVPVAWLVDIKATWPMNKKTTLIILHLSLSFFLLPEEE